MQHPIRLTVSDDLERSRLTVFFRLLLAIPHLIWLGLWGIVAFLTAFLNWFATLFGGRSPQGFHNFLGAYVRYTTHVYAYLYLAANPFPGFTGKPGSYPVDLEIDEPARQNRWITGFRIVLAIPAILLSAALVSVSGSYGGGSNAYGFSGGLVSVLAVFAWFVCLVRTRMPLGFRHAIAYALGYGAQVSGYVFLLTDRYPNSDPLLNPVTERRGDDPVRLVNGDDLRRSRLTVLFRLLLALPHFVWLSLWGVAAFLAGFVNGIVTLFTGQAPESLHRFLAAYVRYAVHVYGFVAVLANPFPGFVGRPGSYPLDLEIDDPAPQNRWTVGFRLFTMIPALAIAGALSLVLLVVGILGWFAALFTARMPRGLENAGAYALRYIAHTHAYAFVLSDRYPYTGPAIAEQLEAQQAPAPA